MVTKKVLGLDPGVLSLGWALIEENEKNEAVQLIDAGALLFNSVYEAQFFTLKNQTRTANRQTRRQRDRRKRRLAKIENFLIKNGLLSQPIDYFHLNNDSIQAQLGNPYQLRKEALYRLLENDELAYAVMHLFKRRGFHSSLKSKTADEKKKEAAAQSIMESVRKANCQTLGEYFCNQMQINPSIRIRGGDHEDSLLGGEKLLRDNLYDELELILNKQIEFGNTLVTSKDKHTKAVIKDELLKQFGIQRPLKGQKRRAFCDFEKKIASFKDKKTGEIRIRTIGLKLAHKFTVSSQEFIIRQTINNLKVEEKDHKTGEVFNVEITKEDKDYFFDKAWNSASGITFKAIKKRLGASDDANINLEYNGKKGIQGNQLLTLFKKPLDKWFKALSMEEQEKLMSDIHTIKGAEYLGLRRRLINHWKLNDEQVDVLVSGLSKNLKPHYLSVSKKAADKLLVELRKGHIYSTACEHVYLKTINLEDSARNVLAKLPTFPFTTNPIVNKSGAVVRKLVNSLIEQYGKIDVIRLELARDLGLSAKGLAELRSKQNRQEKENQLAKDFLFKNNIQINKTNIDKYKLWKETKEESLFPEKINGKWTYRKISAKDLFGATGRFEIEHLLPKSETGDDSFMNKSLCPVSVNADKGKRTPYEYYQKLMTETEIESWIKHVYSVLGDSNKKKRFVMTRKEMMESIKSQSSLNDTRHIARTLSSYLEQVCDKVETIKGGHTAMMRKELDLNVLLGDSAKKSRLDYRHHMVDGLAIALTNRSNLDALTKIKRCNKNDVKYNRKPYSDLHNKLNNRYKKIRQAFEDKFENTFVQHEVENKPRGAFDEDSIFSLMNVEEVASPCGEYTYLKVSKLQSKGLPKLNTIEDLDNEIYSSCKFINSKSSKDVILGKNVKQILDLVFKHKIVLPFEVIESLQSLPNDTVINENIVLKSGNTLKKIKCITAKSDANKCHAVKNKEKEIIGIKKLGNNFCVIGFKSGNPRVVSLFEYLQNKKKYKSITDIIFKGSILEDQDGNRWKVYKFSGQRICCHPVNHMKIDHNNFKGLNCKKENINTLEKTFSFYIKNGFFIYL